MIPSPRVQGRKGYLVPEFGHEKLDPDGRRIPDISECPPPALG